VIDWPALVEYLSSRGMRYLDIAVYVDRSENWVGYLRRGVIKQPTYEQGRLLLELAAQHGYEKVSRESLQTQDLAVGPE